MTKRLRRRTRQIPGGELLRFRCGGCGNCCRLWIPVTDADVRRIAAGTGAPAREIVKFVPRAQVSRNARALIWVRFGPRGEDRRTMALRERRNGCMFLRRNQCEIYPYRPVACRDHPLVVTLDDAERAIRRIERHDACECAGTLDGRVTRAALVKLYREALDEEEAYRDKVRSWNRRPAGATQRDFLEYLLG